MYSTETSISNARQVTEQNTFSQRSETHLNHIVFALLGVVSKQELLDAQFVVGIWVLVCVSNWMPCDWSTSFAKGYTCGMSKKRFVYYFFFFFLEIEIIFAGQIDGRKARRIQCEELSMPSNANANACSPYWMFIKPAPVGYSIDEQNRGLVCDMKSAFRRRIEFNWFSDNFHNSPITQAFCICNWGTLMIHQNKCHHFHRDDAKLFEPLDRRSIKRYFNYRWKWPFRTSNNDEWCFENVQWTQLTVEIFISHCD